MGPIAVTRSRENVAVTFLALLALTAVVAGAALGPLTSAGLIASLGPTRTIGWAGAALLAVAGVWGIMVRWRRRMPASVGLTRDSLQPVPFALGLGIGATGILISVGLGAIGGLRLGRGPEVYHPAAWRLAIGILAFFCSSILQDVLILSGMVACLTARLPRPVAIAIPALIFAAIHLGMPNATVFAFLTDASFAVALATLFFRDEARPALAAPVALHTTWNVGIALILGLPLTGEASSWGFVRHEGGDQLWAGGDYGLEGGLSGFLACLCIIALALALRPRRGAAREAAVVAHTAAN